MSIDRRRARYALGLLVLLHVINYVDRQILAVLLVPIQQELQVSDTAMGFLSGLAFALFYTTAGVPIARIADRGVRRDVIVWGTIVWSAMTALCGVTRSFAQLAAARIGVGIGEASLHPSAHSLISDFFPPNRRATALGIFNIGGNVGVMFGFIAGGYLGETFGWRAAFLVVGLPGLAAALLTRLTLHEPARGLSDGRVDDGTNPSFREVVTYMFARKTIRHIGLAAAFYVFAAYGFTIWGATFLIRVHGLSLAQTGLWMGLVQGVGGGLGTFLGGFVADRLAGRDPRFLCWIPALGGLIALPLLTVFLFAPTAPIALVGYAPAMLFSLFFVGPTYALVQSLARLRMRAQAAALVLLTMNLIGLGVAPLMVGALNDALELRFGAEAVRYSLLATGATSLWAVVHSLLAARSVRADLAAMAAETTSTAAAGQLAGSTA
ncbi:MAG: MFS transporter [Deltaproteobacteria bacterium]|nr:MFS transporter [Deltaproteobacteria bacterium]